jgi:hypothetical protein
MSAGNISSFIRTLTPVALRTDTVVTNHRFGNGLAQPFVSVLQAGTGVLIDAYGVPRVRCASGNPLKKSADDTPLVFPDAPWENFTPDGVAMIEPARVAVSVFVIVNIIVQPGTPPVLRRPTGTSGAADMPASASQTQEATSFGARRTESSTSNPPPTGTSTSPGTGPTDGSDQTPITDQTVSSVPTDIPPATSPDASTPVSPTESPGSSPTDQTSRSQAPETTDPATMTPIQPPPSDEVPSIPPTSDPTLTSSETGSTEVASEVSAPPTEGPRTPSAPVSSGEAGPQT